MTIEISFQDFRKLVQFEIAQIIRFGCPATFSIGFLRPEKQELFGELRDVISEALRETDVMSVYDNNIFLILPGADKKGAQFVSRAIYDFFNGEVVEVYVEYPDDGDSCEKLLNALDTETRKKFGYILESIFKQWDS